MPRAATVPRGGEGARAGPDHRTVFDALAALAARVPEEEACAFVLEGADGSLWVAPVRNAAGDGAAPGEGARARRDRFVADPAEHLRLQRTLRASRGRIAGLFHTHVDGPARLSARDVEGALLDGRPILPGADLLVGGVAGGKLSEIGIFRWDGAAWREVGRLRGAARESPDEVVRGAPRRTRSSTPRAKSQPT